MPNNRTNTFIRQVSSDSGDSSEGILSGVTKFLKQIWRSITAVNDDRAWRTSDGYTEGTDVWGSLVNRYTGSGLTNAEMQANAFTSNEALKQREWEENLANTQYQRGVADMQKAGLNAALMYGNGASPAPTPSGASATSVSPSGMGFQDLISLLSLPLQLRKMSAETKKIQEESQTEKVRRAKVQEEIEDVRASVKQKLVSADLSEEQRYNYSIINSWLDKMQAANLRYLEAQSNLNESTKSRLDALLDGELQLQNMSLKDFLRKWEYMKEEMKKIAAETKLSERDLEDYSVNHMSSGLYGTGLSLQNAFRLWNDTIGKDK